MAHNTIMLICGSRNFPRKDWMTKTFPGCATFGDNAEPEELMRWSISQEAEARTELAKRNCVYRVSGGFVFAEEFALEWCECDEDGDFVCGSDYALAESELIGFGEEEG